MRREEAFSLQKIVKVTFLKKTIKGGRRDEALSALQTEEMKVKKQRSVTARKERRFSGGSASLPGTNSA